MKKLLSLILAVIMLLSIMPMAYAERATFPPEVEEYIDNVAKAFAIINYSLYETSEQEIVRGMLSDVFENLNMVNLGYDTLINIESEGRLDRIVALNESLNEAFAELDKKIADGEVVCVVNGYELSRMVCYKNSHYSNKEQKELQERTIEFNSEKYINIFTESQIAMEEISLMFDSCTGTQAEFDTALEKVKPFFEAQIACLDGDHPYGEYISNNDATEEADGTKTATCEFCGLTNTIVDEGSKIVKQEETEENLSFFEMLIALIKEFFSKIFSIFG